VGSDGYPLENPAKTQAQAGRCAPVGKIGKCFMPMGFTPLAPVFFYIRPRHLRTCASVVKL
jgi:hypothetical protein